jgi:hypothetical protein
VACHGRREAYRVGWRTISSPGDVEIRTKQDVVSFVNLARVRDAAHVKNLEGTAE